MGYLSSNLTRPYRLKAILENYNQDQHEKELVMKAEKEETTCLIDIKQRGSVKTSVQVPAKGIKESLQFKNQ